MNITKLEQNEIAVVSGGEGDSTAIAGEADMHTHIAVGVVSIAVPLAFAIKDAVGAAGSKSDGYGSLSLAGKAKVVAAMVPGLFRFKDVFASLGVLYVVNPILYALGL